MPHLLEVDNLSVAFKTDDGLVRAVNNMTYHLDEGEVLGIVGESGSGKSVSCLTLMGLIPMPPGVIENGQARFRGEDLLSMSKRRIREIRGHQITMIFQDPMTSLNPYLRVSLQLTEAMEVHTGTPRKQALKRAIELLELVGIPDASKRVYDYPHQFSGGMRQRVMIAMALMLDPKILIADEPTTALDVTIQAQILDLLVEVRERLGTAIILITHDLGVVAGLCDRVQVMYGGRLVEAGDTTEVFAHPKHPYTRGLLASVPRLDQTREGALSSIPGNPPDLIHIPSGCAFHPRCGDRFAPCDQQMPELRQLADAPVKAACWLHQDPAAAGSQP